MNSPKEYEDDNEPVLEKNIHTDFSNQMTYGEYLQLDKILSKTCSM